MHIRILLIGLVWVLFGGCSKRYWFRNKIDLADSKKYSVKITVINQAPTFLSDQFVEVMRKSSAKELKRKGYFELPIDSPQFHFTLVLKVDSFNAGIRDFTKKTATYSTTPSKNYYTFRHTVKAILFNCEMRNYKQGWMQWEAADDLYYFGEDRDLGRSVGMVRYLIKSAKPR
jgi:hypothetical protein